MIKSKGYKPSKRCYNYFNKMISKSVWKANEKIPTITNLATTLNVSTTTVRNVLKQFEKSHIIKSWDHLGFYLVTNNIKSGTVKNKNLHYLKELNIQLNIYDSISSGSKIFNQWIIKYNSNNDIILALNEISGQVINTTRDEIFNTINNLINLEDVAKIKNKFIFNELLTKYNRQREILPISKIIVKHKKDLNIDE